MAKLILNSLLIGTVLLPFWTSRDPDARRGLKKTVLGTVAMLAAYLFACVFIYNRL